MSFRVSKCVYPTDLPMSPTDPRGLKVGDLVCTKIYGETPFKIKEVIPPNGKEYSVQSYGFGDLVVPWKRTGVIQNLTLSKTSLQKVAEDKNLPEDIQGVIGKFGGRKRHSTLRKKRLMSRKYCKKTPCRKMGFTQKASCRPYKNCYK